MYQEFNLSSRAGNLRKVLLSGDDSEINNIADEILLFLNHLNDIISRNPKLHAAIPFFSDIIIRLESDPEKALNDKNIRPRITDLLSKIAQ